MAAHATFDIRSFYERSSNTSYDESELRTVLEGVPPLSTGGPWLAGGAVRRTLTGAPLDSDFDFFFKDAEQLAAFESGLVSRGFSLTRETEHHKQLVGVIDGKSRIVQLIRFAFYSTAADVIDSFDYTICQLVTDGAVLVCGEHSLWDLGRKRLAIHKVTFPVATMRRMLKYAGQGYQACAGCVSTLLRAVADDARLLDSGVTYVD